IHSSIPSISPNIHDHPLYSCNLFPFLTEAHCVVHTCCHKAACRIIINNKTNIKKGFAPLQKAGNTMTLKMVKNLLNMPKNQRNNKKHY
ncbi:MAG: hypothetical protein N3F08_05740, partial [Crenarchaeota archaeon]|nr:hypothetical protein [Thermoproteota archaeon]